MGVNWNGPQRSTTGIWCYSGTTCIHIIGPTAGLRAAASRWGTAWVEDIIHRALHLTVINGLALVGADRKRTDARVYWILEEKEGVREIVSSSSLICSFSSFSYWPGFWATANGCLLLLFVGRLRTNLSAMLLCCGTIASQLDRARQILGQNFFDVPYPYWPEAALHCLNVGSSYICNQ